jgi:hypothetical protein
LIVSKKSRMPRTASLLATCIAFGAATCLLGACRTTFPGNCLEPQTTNTAAGDGGTPTTPTNGVDENGDVCVPAPVAASGTPVQEPSRQPAMDPSAAPASAVTAGADQPASRPDPTGATDNGQVVTQAPDPSGTPPAATDETQVGELLQRYYDDFATGDWTRLRQHFWPDATLVTIRSPGLGAPPSVVVLSIGDYIVRHGNGGSRGSKLRIELDTRRIESVGSIASAITHYRAIDSSGQEEQSWRGADLFSLVRHEGQWRIASLVFEGANFGK